MLADIYDMREPTILALVGCYLPGYKAGGPIRTIANMVDRLHDSFTFRIVADDRDYGDEHRYGSVEPNQWTPVGKAEVLYASRSTQTPWGLVRLIRTTPHDVMYLNSLFNWRFTLLPLSIRRLGLIPVKPTVLAPRGELGAGALALKSAKKRVFLRLARRIGLYADLVWQASSSHEAQRIIEVMGVSQSRVFVAPNLPAQSQGGTRDRRMPNRGPLTILFLSRIAPMKNLDFAVRVLSHVHAPVEFIIQGVLEDTAYWAECKDLIAALPPHVRVEYRGQLPHDQVGSVLSTADLLFLPTRGENYGHVIVEALAAGLPVLISDQTPWSEIEVHGAGWALPLGDAAAFAAVIDAYANLTPAARLEQSKRVLAYAANVTCADDAIDANIRLFRSVLAASDSAVDGD